MTQPIAYCFGEVLWDQLPDGPQPGGAPMNVAYHLQKAGIPTVVVSRVGEDAWGDQLKTLLGDLAALVQTDAQYPTGQVIARFNEKMDATYDICAPAAWDYIAYEEARPTYLIYGSLSSRNAVSAATLDRWLDAGAINICDINLRPPFIDPQRIAQLLQKAHIAKLNEHELDTICAMFGGAPALTFLSEAFGLREIVLTRGADGAIYYRDGELFEAKGAPVTVVDTIGSGDALLAAFIAARHGQQSPQESIGKAVAMGAYIATKKGACAPYEYPEFDTFQHHYLTFA
ncbi:MAG TPA: PfkB family carbohydrate kinase [Dinghuibacter sp.]|uniref:PfkB family carbohydrate kinase n=1 Tax=Dinghuibacter sp. TaxID=2024697 RepID=UPI002CFAC975|nr:PfkB family carbohydrate kinase [Dinghuibacter sp.]HTJ12297.1 PfkB family carbohydrate kinase [Dinghuibacter sp.]